MMVRCTHCNLTYDLGKVQVIQRYADCTVFQTPCCNRTADDRQWKSLSDYIELPFGKNDIGFMPGGNFVK